jgi:hypothetical protein
MPEQTRIVSPGPEEGSVRTTAGQILRVPPDWMLLSPGDPGLTRRVKAAGPSWTVQEKRGRKLFSRGVWASRTVIERIRAELAAERSQPSYARKQLAAAQRRNREQNAYVENFCEAVLTFLAFAPVYREIATQVARAVTDHATPVGSGTVARTQRIPIEQRAEAAVIAWMRHQTTGYDDMTIPRVKGKRREVRRLLAQRSKRLLEAYRTGAATDGLVCPLQQALGKCAEPSG